MFHLTYWERSQIQVLLKENYSHREIAQVLNRSNRTISQEIKKYSINWVYIPGIAEIMRKATRALVNSLLHCRIPRWSPLDSYIIDKVQQYWSPEQIVWVRKTRTWEALSIKTVYNHINRTHPELIEKYFRRSWKPYKYWTITAKYIYDRVSIRERPEIANIKWEIWDWEADTMWWKWYRRWLVTLTERKSLYEKAILVINKNATTVTKALCDMLDEIPQKARKSITFDNWTEFANHFELKYRYWIQTYFCDPWRPWQRWLNENFNWLLRQFFPKWSKTSNIKKLKQKDVEMYVWLLNNRPRKTLNYSTPINFLNECVHLK